MVKLGPTGRCAVITGGASTGKEATAGLGIRRPNIIAGRCAAPAENADTDDGGRTTTTTTTTTR